MEIELSYTHVLTTDRHILLRRRGVKGSDEASQLRRFLTPPATQHIRYNLPAERAAVRAGLRKLKKKGHPLAILELSDSDVEVVETPQHFNKRKAKRPPQDSPPPLQRRRLDTMASSSGSSTQPIMLEGSESPPSSPCTPSSPHGSASSPPPGMARRTKWPAGMYAIDMDQGFKKMKNPILLEQFGTRAALFEHVFNAPFKHSTFNDQQLRWKRADRDLCQATIAAGRTPQGLWSMIIGAVSLRR